MESEGRVVDAKPADATGEMSEADIRRLASKHLSGLGVFDGPNEVQPQVYAFSRALLAEMGERVITELNRCERTVHCDCVDATIRRMTGAKP